MDLYDIKQEYKILEEYTYYTHALTDDLIKNIKNFLSEYPKLQNFDEIISDNLELNLVYLEEFYINTEKILNIIESITLSKLNLHKAKIYDINKFLNNKNNANSYFYLDFNDN